MIPGARSTCGRGCLRRRRRWVERVKPLAGGFVAGYVLGAGRWGWAGDGKSRSCGPRFAPSMARVHVIAFALPLPRFAAQTAGPVSPPPTPRRFAAAPDSGAPSTRHKHGALVAPTHGRRNPSDPISPQNPPTMGRRYRRFHGRRGPVERWGGVAVQGRLFAWMRKASLQGRTCGVSCTATPPRPTNSPAAFAVPLAPA